MKTKGCFILSLVLVVLLVSSAFTQEPVYWDVVQKIREEGFQRSQVMEIISYLTDVYGPRLAGSPEYVEAAEWARDKMTEIGLVNSHLEEWGEYGKGWTNNYTSVHMLEPRYQPIIAYPPTYTLSTNGKITGQVVYINYSEIMSEADLDKYRGKLKNAIIISSQPRSILPRFTPAATRRTQEQLDNMAVYTIPVARGGQAGPPQFGRGGRGGRGQVQGDQPRPLSRGQINEFLLSEGIAVFASAGRGDDGTVFVGGGGRASGDPAPPTISMAAEHYNRIFRILEKGIPVTMEVEIRNTFTDDDPMDYNVIAEIPGTDLADEIVMLGGHFDSWHSGTGATDNAAGSAIAIEAVRIIKTLGLQPRRTIRVGLWGAEESGLNGSREYVAEHFASRSGRGGRGGGGGEPAEIKPEYDKFSAYFNIDNGTGRIRGVYLQGNNAVRPIFEEWMKPFHDLEMTHLTINNTGGTDHLSFDRVGLPGFQFIQDGIDYNARTHHSNMDVYDRLVPQDMMQMAVIMASFVYHTAMRDEKLPRKQR